MSDNGGVHDLIHAALQWMKADSKVDIWAEPLGGWQTVRDIAMYRGSWSAVSLVIDNSDQMTIISRTEIKAARPHVPQKESKGYNILNAVDQ